MRYVLPLLLLAFAALLLACSRTSATGLSRATTGTFIQVACLDVNGDRRVNGADAADLLRLPDFDGDGDRDDADAAFPRGVDLPMSPTWNADACLNGGAGAEPEFLVARPSGAPAVLDCAKPDPAFVLVGVGGGVVNLNDRGDAAGIRSIVDGLQRALEDRGAQTLALIGGPAISGGENAQSAGELWLTAATAVFVERYPCARLLLVGHSWGAVTADVVASRLEDRYAGRILDVVDVDRRTELYIGDTVSRPRTAPVFNIYQTNDPALKASPYDAPNAENWDASAEQAPEKGDSGGPLRPVNHTTIDNSQTVKERIIEREVSRAGL